MTPYLAQGLVIVTKCHLMVEVHASGQLEPHRAYVNDEACRKGEDRPTLNAVTAALVIALCLGLKVSQIAPLHSSL